MRYILTVTLSIIVIATFAQQIQNVKAVQQGTKVLVSYDLNDQAGKPYYVKLLMSRDGGTTFGEELKYVTGDIKNSKAGIGKKILWDASQEISYYDGDAIFRVEATLKAAPMPEPIELKCSKVELVNVKGVGNRVTIDFFLSSLMDTQTYIHNQKGNTSLFDNSGNEFAPTGGKFGDTQLGVNKKVIKGIPIKSQLIFDNVASDLTSIPMLKIYISSSGYSSDQCVTYNNEDANFQFRNIPVSR